MQRFFTLILFVSLAFAACKQDPKNPANDPSYQTPEAPPASPLQLGGQWIAMDFCSRANQYGSVLSAMNNAHLPYCFAFDVNPDRPDSVTCYNGFETFNLATKYDNDTLILLNARPGKNLYLVFDSKGDRSITMFDATTGTAQMDRFVKSKANARDGYGAFLIALNHNLFGGTLTPVGKGGSSQVMFTPGGLIQGLSEYDRYRVCTAGDCFVAEDRVDVITLSKKKGENTTQKMFGFRYSAQNDTLTLYNLLNKNPNEKGAYAVGGVAYRFLRKEQ